MVTHGVGIRFHGRLKIWAGIFLLAGIAAVVVTVATASHGPDPTLHIQSDQRALPAGSTAHLTIQSSIPLASSGLTAMVAEGGHSARVTRTYFDAAAWHVTVRAKALPGTAKIVVRLAPFAPASATITVAANDRDSAHDGTPDVLRLDDPADENAFRSWFTFLAEAQFFRETSALPTEISDCAGLIRYAYREALRTHDSAWAAKSGLPLVPAIPSVQKYEYPFTTWGAALFRTGPPDRALALAEFADAETLWRFNTHRVARDLRQARPGDLIFFHQDDAAMAYHSMIFLGPSQIEKDGGPFVIYHTGPQHDTAGRASSGEIRRPAVAELMKHPDPEWRPVTENPHFLGVYRWNILWQ